MSTVQVSTGFKQAEYGGVERAWVKLDLDETRRLVSSLQVAIAVAESESGSFDVSVGDVSVTVSHSDWE